MHKTRDTCSIMKLLLKLIHNIYIKSFLVIKISWNIWEILIRKIISIWYSLFKYLQPFISSVWSIIVKIPLNTIVFLFPKRNFKRYKERNLETKRRFAKRRRAKYVKPSILATSGTERRKSVHENKIPTQFRALDPTLELESIHLSPNVPSS